MCSGFRHRVLVACVGSSGLENGVHDSAGNFHDSGAVVLSLSAVNGTEALQNLAAQVRLQGVRSKSSVYEL